MKKESKEKIALSIERALVRAAIWTFFLGLFYYFFIKDALSSSADVTIPTLIIIAFVPFMSMLRDWSSYEKVKSAARRHNFGGAYNNSQASSNDSNRSFTTSADSAIATNHSYHTHHIDSASIDLRNISFHE